MRAVLSRVSVRRLGRQIALTSDRLCDDRPGRRGVSERRPGVRNGGRPARCLVLVGCGKMGTAMLRGWISAGVASRCVVVEPAGIPAGIESAGEIVWYSPPQGLPAELRPYAVVFAVKPQIADEVVPGYCSWAGPETLFVSIIAGKTLAGLARNLGHAAIVRTMPNTPAAIGRGITVACPNPRVGPAQIALCNRLLAAVGEVGWVDDERLMDAVTAVSGSGPAYVFLLIECLA